MSLILGKPSGGTHTHLYELNGDGRSLCTRAPATFINGSVNLADVTCENCKRILDIFRRDIADHDTQLVDISLPKKKRFKNPKAARVISGKSTKRKSGVTLRSKRSKKGA